MSAHDLLLVTGAAGWLGRSLLEACAAGRAQAPAQAAARSFPRLRALARDEVEAAALREGHPGLEVVTGDVRDPAACARLCEGAAGATLVHAAAVIHPRRPAEFDAVNAGGTARVLEAAATGRLARVVHVSSSSPLGLNPFPEHRFDEASPYRPYLGYGRSKMAAELLVRAAHDAGRVPATIVRAPWFYGVRQPLRQTDFFRMIRDGRAPVVGDGDNVRSMAYVDNLVQGVLLAARAPVAAGRTYWVADARPYRWREIVDTVERVLEEELGRPCARRRVRLPALAGVAARGLDRVGQALGLYDARLHVLGELDRTIACTIDRARRELGYAPEVELEEGMRRSVRWLLAAGVAL